MDRIEITNKTVFVTGVAGFIGANLVMQPGDVPVIYADSAALGRDFGFTPRIGIREGLR